MQRKYGLALVSSCPTPLHTPAGSRPWSRISGLKSRTDTPLGNYIKKRHQEAEQHSVSSTNQQRKVPLSALASNVAENNFVGGCFNATTRLKMVPLPAQYLSQITSNKGKRSVRLHSQRYNPTHDSCDERTAIRYSDSLVNVQKKRERQELHYALGIDQVEQAKQRKALNRIIPHRADCMFYMNGHSANINRRSMFSSNELSKLPPDSLSENRQLYYGRGIQISQTRPSSKAIAKLQEQLINQQAETNSSEFKLEKIRQDSSYRQSPTVSFSIPPPSPTASGRDSLMSAVYGKKAIFITEESRSNN